MNTTGLSIFVYCRIVNAQVYDILKNGPSYTGLVLFIVACTKLFTSNKGKCCKVKESGSSLT